MSPVITVSRLVKASPSDVFELLSTPSRHHEFDGSGTVVSARKGGAPVGLGDTFSMDMRWGMAYSTINRVTEFEQDKLIAWRTLAPAPIGSVIAGRTWRYTLEAQDATSTLVRETWDTRSENVGSRWAMRFLADKTRTSMQQTLERLAEAVVAPS